MGNMLDAGMVSVKLKGTHAVGEASKEAGDGKYINNGNGVLTRHIVQMYLAKHWSFFGDNGWLHTGWVELGKGTAHPDGNKARHWSYFGPNGWLRTGWQDMGKGTGNPDGNNPKHRSYFGDNGWLRTGNQTIDGKKVTFDKKGWLII